MIDHKQIEQLNIDSSDKALLAIDHVKANGPMNDLFLQLRNQR